MQAHQILEKNTPKDEFISLCSNITHHSVVTVMCPFMANNFHSKMMELFHIVKNYMCQKTVQGKQCNNQHRNYEQHCSSAITITKHK